MICPKCEIGSIIKVKFKKSEENALICDFCESLWYEDEKIGTNTGHAFRSFAKDLDQELSLETGDEEDQDHAPVDYKSYK